MKVARDSQIENVLLGLIEGSDIYNGLDKL
jgi:hypothetical protein